MPTQIRTVPLDAASPFSAIVDHSNSRIGMTADLADEQRRSLLVWMSQSDFQQTLQNLWKFAREHNIQVPQ